MEFSDQVLIIQSGKFREADMWVRVLSPTRGLFSAFAFGGSRSKQRFIGCLDVFNHVLFHIKSTNKSRYLVLQEGVLIKGASRLRTDWSRFGIASNCIKYIQAFGVEREGAQDAHSLLSTALDYLEKSKNIATLFVPFFRMRFAFEQGYSLNMEKCGHCDKIFYNRSGVLAVRDGIILCKNCVQKYSGYSTSLSEESLLALKQLVSNNPSEWFLPSISSRARAECAMAIDGFIQYHVGLCWESGRFIRV